MTATMSDDMTITVNGQPRDVPNGTAIASLLEQMKLKPNNVAVELNRRLVRSLAFRLRLFLPCDMTEHVFSAKLLAGRFNFVSL